MKKNSGAWTFYRKAFGLSFVLFAALSLSGCYLAEGAAQLVKMAGQKSNGEQATPSAETAPAKPAAAEEPPPPLAEGTQPAVSVKVEELPAH